MACLVDELRSDGSVTRSRSRPACRSPRMRHSICSRLGVPSGTSVQEGDHPLLRKPVVPLGLLDWLSASKPDATFRLSVRTLRGYNYRSEAHHHEWKSAPHRNPSTSAPQRETEQAAREACGGAGGRARPDRSEAPANVFARPRHDAVQVVPTPWRGVIPAGMFRRRPYYPEIRSTHHARNVPQFGRARRLM